MSNEKLENGNKQIKSVTNLGIVANICLAAVKVFFGVTANSMALVADGIHSLSDMTTDLAVLLGIHFGSKKPDRKHPYGHGRLETFSAGFIGMVLVVVGSAMIYYAALQVAARHVARPRIVVLVIAVVSIIAKEWLYQLTRRIAVRSHSSALYANAWHHRSDAFSSVAVVIGVIALRFGFDYGDQVAAMAVGMMIIFVGVRVLGDCLREFTETAVDSGTVKHIENIINANSSVRDWHKLRTRMVGREVFLDLHILVDPDLSVAAAHEISDSLEKALHEEVHRPVNIIVHIEPDMPELRR